MNHKTSHFLFEKSQTKKRLLFGLLLMSSVIFAQSAKDEKANGTSNEGLLDQFVKSKGNNVIVFDSSNIKQFWIDKTVASQKGVINILLNEGKSSSYESVPLRIQLANVNETQDCKVEIISENDDLSFSILDNYSTVLSSSKKDDDFLSFSVASSVFHLENTPNMFFELKFGSNAKDILSIKKVILSFFENKESSFLSSPGTIRITGKDINTSSKIEETNENSFSVTGTRSSISSIKKIFTTDNTLSTSVTIKNIGETATTIRVGFEACSKEHIWLNGKNYPYSLKDNNLLRIVSAPMESDKIIVDTYLDWAHGCNLALNAQEDYSDIPNIVLAGAIIDNKKLENGQAEITLNQPLKASIKEGTKARIHGSGGAYVYTGVKVLNPGEEETFTATIKKDDSSLVYSNRGLSKGVYYAIPLILSYSATPDKENTILISNYSISY